MELKHTPGPWRIGTPGPNGCHTVGTEHGLMTAMIAHSINEPGQKEQAVANARLIAAAPDLLAAAQEMAYAGFVISGSPELIRLRAAIAKATGTTA